MNGLDIVITVVVCVAFAAAVGFLIYRKLKRKDGCCDCGCEHCSMNCKRKENKDR